MLALIPLLAIFAGGCLRDVNKSALTAAPTGTAQSPTFTPIGEEYLPPTLPDAKPAPLDVEVAEWAGVIADTFNYIEYSYEEFSLPAHYRWFDVQVFYDLNSAVAGWDNVVTTENMAFYMDSRGERSMVMVFVPSPDGQKPAYVTLVYSYDIHASEPEQLLSGEYDAGFQVTTDSFKFPNYTDQFPDGDLTAEEAHALFGNQVCSRLEDGRCIILPAALLWINQMNRLAQEGHCTGMTVISGLLKGHSSEFLRSLEGQSAAAIPRETPILRKIAADWALQMTYEVTGSIVEGTPRHILGELLKIKGLVDIGIFNDQGGHSLLGYGVWDQGNGIFFVRVYDGNFPGEEKLLQIDTNANTWTYSMNGLDPWDDPRTWSGDAGTFTLMFIPIAVYAQDFACPFCPLNGQASISGGPLANPMPARKPASGHTLVTMSGGTSTRNLRAVSSIGERVGIANNELINDMIGARIIRVRGLSNAVALLMPPGIDFQLDFSGSSPSPDNTLLLTTPAFSLAINDLSNQDQSLSFSPTSQQITYTAVNNEDPQFIFTINQGSDSFMFILDGANISAGNSLSMGIDPESGSLTIQGPNNDTSTLSFTIVHTGPAGDAIFTTQNLIIGSGSQASLDFAGWFQTGVLNVVMDQNRDGQPDATGILEDQMLESLLLAGITYNEILTNLDLLSPYMSTSEFIEILVKFADSNMTSEHFIDLMTRYGLNFNLSIEDLVLILKAWNLSDAELARIASIMGFSYADLDALLNPPPDVFVPLLEHPIFLDAPPIVYQDFGDQEEEEEEEEAPVTTVVSPGTITGNLTKNNFAASNITVSLEFCSAAANCGTVSSATTDINGIYTFSVAPLNASETYQVKMINDATISLLGAVFLPKINSLASNQTVAGGDYEIGNIVLSTPANTCEPLASGVNFSWDTITYRDTFLSEQYQLIIYDPTDGDPFWNSGSLGVGVTTEQITTGNFPGVLSTDTVYRWYVGIDDGSSADGQSFEHRNITFSSGTCP